MSRKFSYFFFLVIGYLVFLVYFRDENYSLLCELGDVLGRKEEFRVLGYILVEVLSYMEYGIR